MAPRVKLVAAGRFKGVVEVPPSKSYTHRAVIMASLSQGKSTIRSALLSRDTNATVEACRVMGADIIGSNGSLEVTGSDPRAPPDVVNV